MLASVSGARWAIEECFQTGKGRVRLDHYQVRRWDAWHRLAMTARALLALLRATTTPETGDQHEPLIPLPVNEIRHLIAVGITRLTTTAPLYWSSWRCRHQACESAHYRRRAATT
jgi:hypothetical protein